MPIEIDIELRFEHQSQLNLKQVVIHLPKNYAMEQRGTSSYIVHKNDSISSKPLDEAIISFFHPLTIIRENISTLNGFVNIGMFYNINETVVCPVRLSKLCIKILNQFSVNLDITGYPCNDKE